MLAIRLGVAALIIIALSFFTGNRPIVKFDLSDEAETQSAEDDTVVTVGPLTFEKDKVTLEGEQRNSIEALSEAGVLDDEVLKILETHLAGRKEAEIENEARDLATAGLEIAQQLIPPPQSRQETEQEPGQDSGPEEKTDTVQPSRLSEAELQSLVIERLLSVQTRIRADEETGSGNQIEATVGEYSPLPQPVLALERISGSFSGQSLMGTDFRNKDLSGLDFSNARLTAARFDGSNLSGANFSGAKLHGASFTDAIMTNIDLTHAQAQTATFERAIMTGARLDYGNFASAILKNADLSGATLQDVNLNGAELQGTHLDDAPQAASPL